jgi:hypothetical protein
MPSLKSPMVRIVGSGPSIASISDHDALFNATTVLVNGASILAKERSEFDYYFVVDPEFLAHNPEAFRIGIQRAKNVILSLQAAFVLMKLGLIDRVRGDVYLLDELLYPFKQKGRNFKQLILDADLHPASTKRIGFSMNPQLGTYACGTVIYHAIQVFVASGATRIEIFGMDLSQGRFYRESSPAPTALDKVFHTKLIPSFRLANRVCSELGCKLVNCSLESRLPSDVVSKEDPNLALANTDIRRKEMEERR